MVYLFDCGCFWFTPESSFILPIADEKSTGLLWFFNKRCLLENCKNGHRPIQRRVKIQKNSPLYISFASSTPHPLEFSFLQQESLYGCGSGNPAKEQDLPFTATQLCATTWHTQPGTTWQPETHTASRLPTNVAGLLQKISKIAHKCSRAPPKGLQLSPVLCICVRIWIR